MQFKFKNKFDDGGKLSKTEKIKKIQDYLNIEVTGKWNSETEKSYVEKMKELNLSNTELSEKITGYREEKKDNQTETPFSFKNLNQKTNQNLPIIEETGLCGDSLAKGCSQYVTDKLSALHGISPSEFRSKVGSDHAWNLFTRLKKEGKAVELSKDDELKIGDYVDLGRNRFSGKDDAYDEAQKQGKNPHIGIIVGKTADGKPIIEHYIQGKGVRRDPIDDIRISEKSNTKYEPLRIYRQTVINDPVKQEKLSSNFRKDSSFSFQEREPVKSDVRKWNESLVSFFRESKPGPPTVSTRVLKGIENIANDVAKKFNLTDEELEKLARASYGIVSQESNFGANVTAGARMTSKEAIKSLVVDPLKNNKEERHNTVSRGYNQMKNTNLHYYDKDGNLKKTKAGELFENYNTNIPEHAGATTLAVLAENYEKFRNLYPNASPNDLIYRALVAYNSGYTSAKKNEDLTTRDNFYANSALKKSENVTSQNPQYDHLYKKIRQGTIQGDPTPVFGQTILSGHAFQKMNGGKFKFKNGGKFKFRKSK